VHDFSYCRPVISVDDTFLTKFDTRLKELEKIINDDAKIKLLEQLPKKSKWALAFDEDGSRYVKHLGPHLCFGN
jgi:hypothetical protein